MHYKYFLMASSVLLLSACGGSGSDDTPTINGNEIPILSVANIPSDITKNQTIELIATASDNDGTIISVIWERTAGLKVLDEPIAANSVIINIPSALSYSPKEYAFNVTVTDNEGAIAVKTVSFIVRNSMDEFAAARSLHQGSMGPTLNDDEYRERVSYLLYIVAISPEFNLQY